MKLETLARRIAEKTNCSVAEAIVLGVAKPEDLPNECIIWNGGMEGNGGYRLRLNHNGKTEGHYRVMVRDRPRAVMRFQGKKWGVANILFEALFGKEFENYRLEGACPEPRCVHPRHFDYKPLMTDFKPGKVKRFASVLNGNTSKSGEHDVTSSAQSTSLEGQPNQIFGEADLICEGSDLPDFNFDPNVWTEEDVKDVIEYAYLATEASYWADLLKYDPDLANAPRDVVETYIRSNFRNLSLLPQNNDSQEVAGTY